MRALKSVFDFYINSSVHVALAIVAMSYVTCLEFGASVDINVLSFIGFASITGYNFVKYFGLAKFHHRSLSSKLKAIQVFSLLCFLVMCFFAVQLNKASLIAILIFGVVTFLYAIPLLPNRIFIDKKKQLRSISGLKVYIIAMVWSGVTVFLPLINDEFDINDDVVISAIQRFIFVIVLMLPFEIRDLNYDSLKLSTIPQRIGVSRTKVIGILLLFLLLALEYFKDDINLNNTLSLVLIVVATLLFLNFSTKKQGQYYSSFWVESLPIWWVILLLMFS
ncbi:membrane protein [Psychroserpens jangbogonensis]|uniref:membrane protein n=1 Tax=Psychroserpens jangbogonensis TaxID=1484460 RepID=UPI00053F1C69|nr:membrane protein [Psychroserpens jangbogonensis]